MKFSLNELDITMKVCKKDNTGSYYDPELYSRYNVKRGLRNEDGDSVVVRLTEIGDVQSYIMDENKKIPLEGRLIYRGIDVYDLVNACMSEDRFGFEECAYLFCFSECFQPESS